MTNWIIERGPSGIYPQSIELGFKANEAFDSDAAENWFRRAMTSADNHEATSGYMGLAALESKWGSQDQARDMMMEVANTGRLDAIVNVGKTFLEDGNLIKAEEFLQKADVAKAEDYVRGQALNSLGSIALERQDEAIALSYFERAAKLGDNYAKFNLASIAEDKGNIDLARTWLWQIEDDLEAKASYASLTHYLIEELKKPWCFPEKLAEKSNDFDPKVRKAVAGNTTTPMDALEHLLNDQDTIVRRLAQQTLKKNNKHM